MPAKKPTAPLQAQDKLTFLLSLVPYLVERDRVSVTEVATHFGVKPEQIREAVRLIAVSGVPGETHTYQYEDLFDIAWDDFEENDQIVITNHVAIDDSPRFSAREAAALIAGLQYLSSLPANADRAAVASLMSKLSRGASSLPSQVAVERTESDVTVALIRESVDADWYLRGWCHLREAVRTFRLDRISNLSVTQLPTSHTAGDVTLPETLFEGSPDDLVVTIDVAPAAEALLADYIPDGAVRTEVDGRVRTTVRVSHYHGLKRLVASLPGVATVVEPAAARQMVAEWAAAGASRYHG